MFCHKSYTIGCPWFNIANSRIQTNIRIRYKKQYRSFTVVYVLINYLVVCKLCVVKLHLLNKKVSVSSDILVGHVTSSQNESGLSKYLMVLE